MVPYEMPKIKVGDVVYHFEQPNSPFFRVGLVTAVYERTISLHVFTENTYNSLPTGAVRHRADPDRKILNEAGYWDYSDQYKAYLKLEDQVLELKALVDSLLAESGQKRGKREKAEV